MNSRATWNRNSNGVEKPHYKIQQAQINRSNWFSKGLEDAQNNQQSYADQSTFFSKDFGANPLLSSSKMWKHSIVKEEASPQSRIIDETMCGIQSPC